MEHNVAYIGMYFSILEAIHILITQVIGANVTILVFLTTICSLGKDHWVLLTKQNFAPIGLYKCIVIPFPRSYNRLPLLS